MLLTGQLHESLEPQLWIGIVNKKCSEEASKTAHDTWQGSLLRRRVVSMRILAPIDFA